MDMRSNFDPSMIPNRDNFGSSERKMMTEEEK